MVDVRSRSSSPVVVVWHLTYDTPEYVIGHDGVKTVIPPQLI